MPTPAFIDRLNVQTTTFVNNADARGGVNYAYGDAAMPVGFDPSAIAEPDAGAVVLANTNIVVRETTLSILKPTSFVAVNAALFVNNIDYTSQFVGVYLNLNRQPDFSAQSAIVVEPAPQVVFWS